MRVTKPNLVLLASVLAVMSAVYAAGVTYDWIITTGGLRLSTGNDPAAAPPAKTIQFGAQGRIALEAANALVSVSDANSNQVNSLGNGILEQQDTRDATHWSS